MSCCQPTVSGSTGIGSGTGVPASGGGLLPYVGASAFPATTNGGVVTNIGESKTSPPKTTTQTESLSLATCSDCRKRLGMILLFLLVLYAVSRK